MYRHLTLGNGHSLEVRRGSQAGEDTNRMLILSSWNCGGSESGHPRRIAIELGIRLVGVVLQ